MWHTSIRIVTSGVNFKTAINGHTVFSYNDCSVSMHDNFHSAMAVKIVTTEHPEKDTWIKH